MKYEAEITNGIEETISEKTVQLSDNLVQVQETDFRTTDIKLFDDESVNKAFDILFEATLEEIRSNP